MTLPQKQLDGFFFFLSWRTRLQHCSLHGVLASAVNTASLAKWLKASTPKEEGPEFESRLRRDFSGSSHASDLKIGTPAAVLPGA